MLLEDQPERSSLGERGELGLKIRPELRSDLARLPHQIGEPGQE
jgi:hypothetical protein